jgi:hypothetical protein
LANETVIQAGNADGNPEFLTPERVRIALGASWEAEGCAMAALATLNNKSLDRAVSESTLRALLLRLRTLSRVAMGAIDDEGENAESLQQRLVGADYAED